MKILGIEYPKSLIDIKPQLESGVLVKIAEYPKSLIDIKPQQQKTVVAPAL